MRLLLNVTLTVELVAELFSRVSVTPREMSLFFFDNDNTTSVPVLYPSGSSSTLDTSVPV